MSEIKTIPSVSINELRTLIPAIGKELTVVVQSEPGCGKTSLLKMMEEDMGDAYEYIYVDCPVKDMSDIAMTIPNHDSKTLETYVGSLFNLASPKPKVILLDEFMKSPKLLQVIFTRMMLERCVGDTPLPQGSIVFATSNNSSDGVGDSMLAHAGNRVCIVKMDKPDVDGWLPWATANGISSVVRAWVSMNKRCLKSYTQSGQADVIVKVRDAIGENATLAALAGTIGASAAGSMSAFFSIEKQLPDFDDIIKAPSTIEVPTDNAAILMVIFNGVDSITTQDMMTKFMVFVKRIASKELQSLFFTMSMRNSKTVSIARGNEDIKTWAVSNSHLF
jgi:Viral (Superfamily 1) RNA helicase